MKKLTSPANIITVTGAILTVVGGIAYLTGAVNLSVPTLFYGFPIFLGGLALKTTELPPAKRVVEASIFAKQREKAQPELAKLVGDVTRWKYGQNAHLESSLKVLELWDEANPPKLIEIEEMSSKKGYGVRIRFEFAGVSLDRWKEKQERLGRFFAKGLTAEILTPSENELDLLLTPSLSNDS
tara:strand:+ start:228 stop:776 length:549 start_codon:yes stop_codon:yes gene_type:complete